MALGSDGRTGALLVDRGVSAVTGETVCRHPVEGMFGNGSFYHIAYNNAKIRMCFTTRGNI